MRAPCSNSALIGFCIGLFIGLVVLFSDTEDFKTRGCVTSSNGNEGLSAISEYLAATPLTILKTNYATRKDQTSFKRPRYFYTELGLRKKLCLNVLMTEKDETDYVMALNATAASYVDKFSIFIGGNAADETVLKKVKKLGFKNVVDLSQVKNPRETVDLNDVQNQKLSFDKYETVVRLLGYLKSTKIPKNYDYFVFVPAKSYLDAKAVLELVRKTSVSQDVAWGKVDGKKCDVDHGFILSSRLVKNFGVKTELCYMNVALDLPDHFAKCLEMIYLNFPCAPIPVVNVSVENSTFTKRVDRPEAIFSRHRQSLTNQHEKLHSQVKNLQDHIHVAHVKIPAKFREGVQSWPIGYSEAPQPKTRFDVEKWEFIRQNLKFGGCSTTSDNLVRGADAQDVQQISNSTLAFIKSETGLNTTVIQISSLYRRFDPIRGLEYIIDIENTATNKTIRVQALKALSKVELVPVPYVTENKKVYILVPVMFEPIAAAIESFLDRYFDRKMDNKDNTVLILLFLSPAKDNLPSAGEHVPSPGEIEAVKNLINRYNIKVGKGSLSTEPPKASYILVPRSSSKNFNPLLAGIDTVIKRIVGSDSIMFTSDLSVTFEDAFLNRIRISVIKGWQAFSPVPFVQYHPSIIPTTSNATLTVSKNQGYFNPSFWQFLGFHSSDYLQARKALNSTFPATLNSPKDFGVLQKLFLHQLPHLHILRAPDPNFRLRRQYLDNHFQINSTQSCLLIKCGNKNQLSRHIFGNAFQDL